MVRSSLILSVLLLLCASCEQPLTAGSGLSAAGRSSMETTCNDWACNRAKMISVGSASSCAVLASGAVLCWGDNQEGQLGNGRNVTSATPVFVSGLSNAASVSVGDVHACAVTADGQVLCWGDNQFGQLGNGTTVDSNVPVAAVGLAAAKEVSCGGNHCCALARDGSVSCWGQTDNIPLGRMGDTNVCPFPTDVSAALGATVSAITVGSDRACAILENGTAVCFGSNEYGKLGGGDNNAHAAPVAVRGLVNATKIVLGDDHACALLANGTVSCWGWKGDHLLGNDQALGANEVESSIPIPVIGLSGIVDLAAGDFHTCAISENGSISCWGCNGSGQLGDDMTTGSLPVTVSATNALAVGAGADSTCAILFSGAISCWGYGGYGQLGNGMSGDNVMSATPVGVRWPTAP